MPEGFLSSESADDDFMAELRCLCSKFFTLRHLPLRVAIMNLIDSSNLVYV